MHVCLISSQLPPAPGSGGIGRYTEQLAIALARQGVKVSVVTAESPQLTVDSPIDPATIHRVVTDPHPRPLRLAARVLGMSGARMAWARSAALIRRARELHQEDRVDVMEAPLYGAEGLSYRASIRIPLVVRLETPEFVVREHHGLRRARLAELTERRALSRATRAAAISRSIGDLVCTRYGFSAANVDYAPLGLDPAPERVLPEAPRGLFVGRLEPRKGAAAVIDALATVLVADSNLTFDFVGADSATAPGGKLHKEYAESILPPPALSRVKFHGYVAEEDLERRYREASFFVAPSRYESFGIIYLEAMRHSLPVIAVARGGATEVLDNSCALFVSRSDCAELAKAMSLLAADGSLRTRLGQAGRARLESVFSMRAMAEATLTCYERAIQQFRG